MIMDGGRSNVSAWSACLTMPPDAFQTRKKRSSLLSTTLELKHFTYIYPHTHTLHDRLDPAPRV